MKQQCIQELGNRSGEEAAYLHAVPSSVEGETACLHSASHMRVCLQAHQLYLLVDESARHTTFPCLMAANRSLVMGREALQQRKVLILHNRELLLA